MINPSEVSNVTNKVFELFVQAQASSDVREGTRLRAQALMYSCDFLERISKDDFSIQYALVTQKGDEESFRIEKQLKYGAVELVSRDSTHFEDFLKREHELLKQSGMNFDVVDQIIQRVRNEVCHFMNDPASGDDLARAIDNLRNTVCNQSAKLLASFRRAETGLALVYCFGGIAFIAVNISASGIMSPIGVGASAAIGGSLLKDAVKEFVNWVSIEQRKT